MIQERPDIGGAFLCGFGKNQTVYEHIHRYVRKRREGKGILTGRRENIERFLQILRCGGTVVQRMVNIHIGWDNGYSAFVISDAERLSFVPGAVRRNCGDGCITACRKRECCQPGIGAHINDGLLIPADAGEKDEAAEVVMLLKQLHEALLPPAACSDRLCGSFPVCRCHKTAQILYPHHAHIVLCKATDCIIL